MTEPYYSDELVTLYHGDCRDVLPHVEFDAVVTDPPYGTGFYPTDTDVFTPDLLALLVDRSTTCAVFGWPEWLVGLCVSTGLRPSEWVTWWASNAGTKSAPSKTIVRESECVAVFGPVHPVKVARTRPLHIFTSPNQRGTSHGDPDSRYASDVWTDAAPGVGFHRHLREHPNQKPLSVGVKLAELVGGSSLFDPFAGSGTFLVAAKSLGRKAIGVELEERYCEIAAKRLAQGVLDFGSAS